MGPMTYWRVLRERWTFVVGGVLIGAIAAVVLLAFVPLRYSSQSTLLLTSTAPQGDVTAAYDGAMLAQQQVQAYLPLLEGPQFAAAVSAELASRGIVEDPGAVESALGATTAGETPVVLLTASAPSPELAQSRAAAAADAAAALVVTVEQPQAETPPSLVGRVVAPASMPGAPFPGPGLVLVVALLGGVVLGAVLALVRDATDRSVRTPQQVERAAGVPFLGALDYDRRHRTHPLALHQGPRSTRAEAIGVIRAALALRRAAPRREVLLVTSPLPDEGKTSFACDLAIAAAQGGRRVLLVCADLRRPRFGAFLGIEEAVGLSTVLAGHVDRVMAVQQWGQGLLDVLPSGRLPPRPGDAVSTPRMASLLEECRRTYDLVVLDTPPVLAVADAVLIARVVDSCVLVVSRGRSSPRDVEEASSRLRAGGVLVGTVLSRATPGTRPRYHSDSRPDEVRRLEPDPVRGRPPESVEPQADVGEPALAGTQLAPSPRSGRIEGEPRTGSVGTSVLVQRTEPAKSAGSRYRELACVAPSPHDDAGVAKVQVDAGAQSESVAEESDTEDSSEGVEVDMNRDSRVALGSQGPSEEDDRATTTAERSP